eukprot:CAMPEP_0185267120 /NCGR_PEP_ID=MMETSP1359-20130426/33464_1 /TAXON_ID=552665 /ORGANISM="Bigelowiella longifila, Strain CCMP242" /LENGTH=279 /DNA_ID=CAMNT_0027857333 /DNA_START=182 /DNA_END=1021 /DNA_ORIENTATION=-
MRCLWTYRVILPFITVANLLLSITTHGSLSREIGFSFEDDGLCHSKKSQQHMRGNHPAERDGARGAMMERAKQDLEALSEDIKELGQLLGRQNITDETIEDMMHSPGSDFGRITDCPTEDCRIPGGLEALLRNCSDLLHRNPENDDDEISENHERELADGESNLHDGGSNDDARDANMESSIIHDRFGALNSLINEGLDKQWEITKKYGSNSSEWEIHTKKMAERALALNNGILGSIMGGAGQITSQIGEMEEKNNFMKQALSAIHGQDSSGATNSTEK